MVSRETQWLTQFERLNAFINENGGQEPTHSNGGSALYAWLTNQRSHYGRNPHAQDWPWKKEMLEGIGVDLERSGYREKKWLANCLRLQEWMEQGGGNKMPSQLVDQERPLYSWLRTQRKQYERNPKGQDWIWKKEMLEKFGIDLERKQQGVKRTVAVAGKQIARKQTATTKQPLVATTKQALAAASKQSFEDLWNSNYAKLKNFMRENGGRRPTPKTNSSLANWIQNQRQSYKKAPDRDYWARRIDLFAKAGIAMNPGGAVVKDNKSTDTEPPQEDAGWIDYSVVKSVFGKTAPMSQFKVAGKSAALDSPLIQGHSTRSSNSPLDHDAAPAASPNSFSLPPDKKALFKVAGKSTAALDSSTSNLSSASSSLPPTNYAESWHGDAGFIEGDYYAYSEPRTPGVSSEPATSSLSEWGDPEVNYGGYVSLMPETTANNPFTPLSSAPQSPGDLSHVQSPGDWNHGVVVPSVESRYKLYSNVDSSREVLTTVDSMADTPAERLYLGHAWALNENGKRVLHPKKRQAIANARRRKARILRRCPMHSVR